MKTTIPTELEYQRRELASFLGSKHSFFDSTRDFAENLQGMDITEPIEWIENGSYGAGACLALQNTLRNVTKRSNARAMVGNTVLHAFYGKPFAYYSRLPKPVQGKLDAAVDAFLAREKSFAITPTPGL